ncbi:MAG: hypothetical protein DI579_00080 [Lawsonella clevelandensis]|uniref:Uncharacterized protein n=1 Tax=Lawsonella clevelandensis TaxID=1528099 RepID=A0A2W5IBW9_9ACTN|nr:MAG: hypothetical protein DI579_00080 [Lawsonella clevelandensis]
MGKNLFSYLCFVIQPPAAHASCESVIFLLTGRVKHGYVPLIVLSRDIMKIQYHYHDQCVAKPITSIDLSLFFCRKTLVVREKEAEKNFFFA